MIKKIIYEINRVFNMLLNVIEEVIDFLIIKENYMCIYEINRVLNVWEIIGFQKV